MTIGIKAIGSYVPKTALDNLALAESFGESEDFVKGKLGALRLPRKEADQETSDLCVEAVNALQAKTSELDLNQVDAIVVVTQNGDGCGLPHTAAVVQKKLGLRTDIVAFDVSLGCSGYVYGLYILQGMMQASGLKNGLLITADPYSKVIDTTDRVTSMLFGDAATATWLGGTPVLNLGAVAYGTDGEGEEFLKVHDGVLSMNGRQVFNFAATKVAPHIKQVIEKQQLTEEDIDAFVVHQGSAAIVDAISRRFQHKERFIKDIEDTGNTVSSSIPLLLERHVLASLDAYQNLIVCGFGVGFSWATAVLSKNQS